MKKSLLFLFGVIFAFSTQAQLVDVEVEVYAEHDGMVGMTDLTGYTTYRVYAVCQSQNDFVSAIYGLAGTPLEITSTTGFWQSPLGANTGSQLNGNVFGTFPEVQYDSFVTIGRASSLDPGTDITAQQAGSEPWLDAFAAGEDIVINGNIGGAWFTLFPGENGYAGDDFKVLIGQFTTQGVVSGFVNAQIFLNGVQADDANYTCFPFSSDPAAIFGCTDPIANNYNADADVNDCSCDYTCTLEVTSVTTVETTCPTTNDGSVTVTVAGQQGAVTYALDGNNPVALSTFNNLSGGMHTIVVTDTQGCVVELEFEVPSPDPVAVTIQVASGISCNGEQDAVITGTATGGNGVYQFDLNSNLANPVSTLEFSDLAPGLYTVYAIDENGCTGQSTSLTITQPLAVNVNITAQADATCSDSEDGTIVCIGTGGTGGLQYSVDNENFQASNIFNVGTGDYSVYAMDANGCTDISTIVATIEAPDPIDMDATVAAILCAGDMNGAISGTAIGGNGGYMYAINGDAPVNMVDLMDLAAGTYEIVVTDDEGCTATFEYVLTDPEAVAAEAAVTNPACAGDENGEVELSGAGGTGEYTYSMNGGMEQDNNVFDGLAEGMYDFVVTDSNGCSAETSAQIVSPTAVEVTDSSVSEESAAGANDGAIDITVAGGTGNYTYDWSGPGGFSSDAEDIDGLAGGDYAVTVTDENGCSTTFEISVVTSILELGTDVTFVVSPNPSNGIFVLNIEGLNGQNVAVRVLDASGRVIINEQLNGTAAELRHELDMTGVANGLYYLNLTVGGSNATTTLVKQY
jgi:hypothetical protein